MTDTLLKTLESELGTGKDNPRYNYSGNGFEGKLYDPNLDITDIAKRMRTILKEKYPECRFSITTERYAGGRSMAVRLMSAPFRVFTKPEEAEEVYPLATRGGHYRSVEDVRAHLTSIGSRGHTDVNHYWLEHAWDLTPKAREVMSFVKKLANAYNYDDSDAMTDYFHTNFYFSTSIGKWDKPFTRSNSTRHG